jgi:hypothetical protein
VDLSGGRSLKLSLSFCDTWSRACTTYRDPLLNAAEAVPIRVDESREIAAGGQRAEGVPTTSARADGNGIISLLRRTLPLFNVVLRPATVTLILAIVLITAVIMLRNGSSPVSAAELDRRKELVLDGLGALPRAPQVKLEVVTAAEATKQQMKLPGGPLTVRRVEIRGDRIPVYSEL